MHPTSPNAKLVWHSFLPTVMAKLFWYAWSPSEVQCLVVVMPQLQKKNIGELTSGVPAITIFVPKIGQENSHFCHEGTEIGQKSGFLKTTKSPFHVPSMGPHNSFDPRFAVEG